jgi:hypothetical protein
MAGEPGGVTWGDLSTDVKGKVDGFVFSQGAPAETWTIKHNLGRFPSVTVQDTAGDEVDGITEYLTDNEVMIVFSAPVAGEAFLN